MSELAEIREAIQGTKVVLKGTLKMLRTTSQFLSDLERRLEELDAEPLEAERDEHIASSRSDDGIEPIETEDFWGRNRSSRVRV